MEYVLGCVADVGGDSERAAQMPRSVCVEHAQCLFKHKPEYFWAQHLQLPS